MGLSSNSNYVHRLILEISEMSKNENKSKELHFNIQWIASDILDGVQDMINNRSVNTADDRGRTALHLAAEKGSWIFERWIRRITNESLSSGDGRMVDLLIQVGADVNIVDNGGVSALHYAALNSNFLSFQLKNLLVK